MGRKVKQKNPKPLKKDLPEKSFPKWIPGALLLGWGSALLLSLLSFRTENPQANWLGLIGYALGYLSQYLFGLGAFFIPCFLFFIGAHLVSNRPLLQAKRKIFSLLLLFFSTVMILSFISATLPGLSSTFRSFVYTHSIYEATNSFLSQEHTFLGGVPSFHLYADAHLFNFSRFLGAPGSLLLFLVIWGAGFLLLTSLTPRQLGRLLLSFWKFLFPTKAKLCLSDAQNTASRSPYKAPDLVFERPKLETLPKKEEIPPPQNRVFTNERKPKEKCDIPIIAPRHIQGDFSKYLLPPPSLLTEVEASPLAEQKSDLRQHAKVLEETLLSFGIEARVGDIHCGPTITLFEVHPAIGVKVQKIKTLENDIALNMQAKSIRIIAPIPGKAAVGIEVPNLHPQEVSFREILESYQKSGKKYQIPLLLGKLVGGEDLWSDLTKMPHLIIAGATGSGKSVSINTIVMSILMSARPDEIKIVMVDPKKVELTGYSNLPHMLAPVITEPHGAKQALSWLVGEMQRRYEFCRRLGIRNITSFNSRKINTEMEKALDIEIPEKLPYIVVIIDELADLMMVSASDIETPIARIAQMARAVGIHMILATQRPSREVITGLIKANFPCRIAFKVASRVNSQIIIDETGSETLLGNGDMLFLPPGTSTLLRAQGAFIRDADINKVIEYITTQSPANYMIPSFDNFREDLNSGSFEEEEEESDSLFLDAKNLVLETGTASTTFLQRKLKIGYARAASLMDLLEAKGIISPQEGAKPRKVFYPASQKEREEEED